MLLIYNCCCPIAQLCLTLCDTVDYSTIVMPSKYLILCHPFILLSSVFPSIRIFSNELALLIRWPKYWSFSFNISLSNV